MPAPWPPTSTAALVGIERANPRQGRRNSRRQMGHWRWSTCRLSAGVSETTLGQGTMLRSPIAVRRPPEASRRPRHGATSSAVHGQGEVWDGVDQPPKSSRGVPLRKPLPAGCSAAPPARRCVRTGDGMQSAIEAIWKSPAKASSANRAKSNRPCRQVMYVVRPRRSRSMDRFPRNVSSWRLQRRRVLGGQ